MLILICSPCPSPGLVSRSRLKTTIIKWPLNFRDADRGEWGMQATASTLARHGEALSSLSIVILQLSTINTVEIRIRIKGHSLRRACQYRRANDYFNKAYYEYYKAYYEYYE